MAERTIGRRLIAAACFLTILWSTLPLSSCASGFQEATLSDVPIRVFRSDSQEVDADIVFESAQRAVHEKLPQAYFRLLVFHGKARDLPALRGTLNVLFVEVRSGFLRERVLVASVSVDTQRQKMRLEFADESDHYISTERQVFPGDEAIKRASAIASRHLAELGFSDCEVTLAHLGESWSVAPRALPVGTQPCHFDRFEIVNGEIR